MHLYTSFNFSKSCLFCEKPEFFLFAFNPEEMATVEQLPPLVLLIITQLKDRK